MRISRVQFADAGSVVGCAVVIDVLRAFTAAAHAFAAGAAHITLTADPEEALRLRERSPDALVFGEIGGFKPLAFDFGNSPARLAEADLRGRALIQCTGAGTAPAMRVRAQADDVLAASFVCARATAAYLARAAHPQVTLVVTGTHCGWDGDEDLACAEYIAALLAGDHPDPAPYVDRVLSSKPGRFLADTAHPEYEEGDLECCTAVDRFDFAMRGERRGGRLVLTAVPA